MCDTSGTINNNNRSSLSATNESNCVSTSASVETRNGRRNSPALLDSGYGSACPATPVDNANSNSISSDSAFKKRERTQNWNQEEKEYLLDLCRTDVHVIENKRYDARHTEAKAKVWQSIHKRFSAQFGVERSVNRLKEQWRRMKAAARAEMQDYKKRQAKVGVEMAENKKPSNFTFKVFNLLEDASRVCEMELPIKAYGSSDIPDANLVSVTKPDADETPAVNEYKKENSAEPVLQMDVDEPKTKIELDTKDLSIISTEHKIDANLNSSDTDSYDSDDSFLKPSLSDTDMQTTDKYKSPDIQQKKLSQQARIFKMKRKEHLLRMKLLRTQLEQLVRSGELLESCKLVLDTNSVGQNIAK